jgi:hypothetical protein
MRLPKSKIGRVFVVIYLVAASFLIYLAFTCSGWVCDVVELPVTIPFGFLWLILLQWLDPIFAFGSITYAPFKNWFFIIPTLVGNSVIFYWLGVGIGKLCIKLFPKPSA